MRRVVRNLLVAVTVMVFGVVWSAAAQPPTTTTTTTTTTDTTGTTGVKNTAKKGAEKTKSGAEKAVDKTKEGSKKLAHETKKGAAKTGEVVTDAWISTRIHADMVNEDTLHDSDVHVDVKNHVVTLTGTVLSGAGRARAVQIAKGTKGVDKVIDRLTIGPKR